MPLELLFVCTVNNSRRSRSHIPIFPKNSGSFVEHDKVALKENMRKEVQGKLYDKRHRLKKLPESSKGDKDWVVDIRLYGEDVYQDNNPNPYITRTEKSNTVRRNGWLVVLAAYQHDLEQCDCARIIRNLMQTSAPCKMESNVNRLQSGISRHCESAISGSWANSTEYKQCIDRNRQPS